MAKFVAAVDSKNKYPDHNLFECCLIGRSNVGKSSIINALSKEKIAYTSKMPGRTQTINFYDFDKFFLVDLPGYGYANVKKTKKEKLAAIAEEYLYHRPQLMSVVQVCDINVISDLDLEMKDYLLTKFDNYILCLNKIDKLSVSQQKNQFKKIQELFKLPEDSIILVSAKNNINLTKLLNKIKFWTKK